MNDYDIFMACMGGILIGMIVVIGILWQVDDD